MTSRAMLGRHAAETRRTLTTCGTGQRYSRGTLDPERNKLAKGVDARDMSIRPSTARNLTTVRPRRVRRSAEYSDPEPLWLRMRLTVLGCAGASRPGVGVLGVPRRRGRFRLLLDFGSGSLSASSDTPG